MFQRFSILRAQKVNSQWEMLVERHPIVHTGFREDLLLNAHCYDASQFFRISIVLFNLNFRL